MKFRNDIQGLRAVAFLTVFIFHLNKEWLPGGFLGVDLFFVISGFLITTITVNDIERGKFSFLDFYKKRLSRIVPAYYLLLLITAIAGSVIFLSTDITQFRETLIRAALFVSNRVFSSGESYFGATLSQNPLLHTWSLAIEMQFYVLLPFVLFFAGKHTKMILYILLIFFALYSSYEIVFRENKLNMYFSLLARIPEFLVGSLCGLYIRNGIKFNPRHSDIIATLSVITLIFCFFIITEESYFPGLLAIVPSIAVGLLMMVESFWSKLLSSKLMVYIGTLSYSLYLWHWPILAFMRYLADSYELSSLHLFIAPILTFATAYLSYNFIEKKFSIKNWNTFVYKGFAFTLVFFAFTYFAMPRIKLAKSMPPQYTSPSFGMKSHNSKTFEKFGDQSKNDSILLIGDSHALMLKPFLHEVGVKYNFSFKTLTTDGYPAIIGIDRNEIPENRLRIFNKSQNFIPTTDSLVKSSKIIIINSVGFDRLPSMQKALNHLVLNLSEGQKLIVVNTFPLINKNPLKINLGFVKRSSERFTLSSNNANKEILLNASKNRNVFYFDISDSKCFKDGPYINDTVSYYNKDHINTFGSIKLSKEKGATFNSLLREIRRHNK